MTRSRALATFRYGAPPLFSMATTATLDRSKHMMAIDKHGRQRELDDDDVLPDGARIRVGLEFMDSAQRAVAQQSKRTLTDAHGNAPGHRPGYVFSTDSNN